MMQNVSPIERAFELARSGRHKTVQDVTRQLDREGYDSRQINGPTLLRQLTRLMRSTMREGHEPDARAEEVVPAGRSPSPSKELAGRGIVTSRLRHL